MQAVRRERDGDDQGRREELTRVKAGDVGRGALVVAGGAALGAGVGALNLRGSPQGADALGRALAPIGGAVAGVLLATAGGLGVALLGPPKWRNVGWGAAAAGGGVILIGLGVTFVRSASATQPPQTTQPQTPPATPVGAP